MELAKLFDKHILPPSLKSTVPHSSFNVASFFLPWLMNYDFYKLAVESSERENVTKIHIYLCKSSATVNTIYFRSVLLYTVSIFIDRFYFAVHSMDVCCMSFNPLINMEINQELWKSH